MKKDQFHRIIGGYSEPPGRKPFTVDDVKQAWKLLQNMPLPEPKPLIMVHWMLPMQQSLRACDVLTKEEYMIDSGEQIHGFQVGNVTYISQQVYDKLQELPAGEPISSVVALYGIEVIGNPLPFDK